MPKIDGQQDPMAFMSFMVSSSKIRFTARLVDMNWSEKLQDMIGELEIMIPGTFDLMLGNEDLLTNDSAEYVLMVDSEDAVMAQEIITNMEF